MNSALSPFAPENLVSRDSHEDEFSSHTSSKQRSPRLLLPGKQPQQGQELAAASLNDAASRHLRKSFPSATPLAFGGSAESTQRSWRFVLTHEGTTSILVKLWSLRLERDILEIGVGGNPKVGGFSNLGFYRPGQRIVGIDPALSGKPSLDLELAEKKAKEKGLTLQGVGGVAEDLPFESGSFDAVVSTLVFCSVRDPAAALREVSRVLRPGGKFLFVEHVHAPEEGLSILGLRQQQDLLDPLQQVLADGCHLTRETDRLIRDASRESPGSRLFSRIESFESIRINSMWPVSEQVFGVVVK